MSEVVKDSKTVLERVLNHFQLPSENNWTMYMIPMMMKGFFENRNVFIPNLTTLDYILMPYTAYIYNACT